MESPRISPDTYHHLIYYKEARIYNGEKTVFNKWDYKHYFLSNFLSNFPGGTKELL